MNSRHFHSRAVGFQISLPGDISHEPEMAIKLAKGQVVITSKPFVFALNSEERLLRCDQCFSPICKSYPRISCDSCGYVTFCSDKCKSESEERGEHRVECATTRHRPIRNLTRLMARVLHRLQTNTLYQSSECIHGNKRDWNCLMDHYEDIVHDASAMRIFELLYEELELIFGQQLSQLASVQMLLTIYGKLLVNTFAIHEENSFRQIGRALYLGPSIFDHSCSPDLLYRFEGTRLSIVAMADVEVDDIRSLYISYIDEFDSYEERRRLLRSGFYFDCACARCCSDAKGFATLRTEPSLQSICDQIDDFYCTSSAVSELATFARQFCLPQATERRLTKQLTRVDRVSKCDTAIRHNLSKLSAQRWPTPLAWAKIEVCQSIHRQIQQLNGGESQSLHSVQGVKIVEFDACFRQDVALFEQLMHIYAKYYGPHHPRLQYKLWCWIGILLQRLFALCQTRKFSPQPNECNTEQLQMLFAIIFDLYRQAKLYNRFMRDALRVE